MTDRPITVERRAQPGAGREPRCLLTTLHPERALSRALVQHLVDEIPGVAFTLEPDPTVDAVWVCGYERGTAHLVAELRGRHPDALLFVTGRGALELWQDEVLRAGADRVGAWPVPYADIARVLRGARARRA